MSDNDGTIILLDGERYYSTILFAGTQGLDWLAAVWRKPGGPWECSYRIRYHRDEKDFNSADTRSVYHLTARSDAEAEKQRIMSALNAIMKVAGTFFRMDLTRLDVETSDPVAIERALRGTGWAKFGTRSAFGEQPEPRA